MHLNIFDLYFGWFSHIWEKFSYKQYLLRCTTDHAKYSYFSFQVMQILTLMQTHCFIWNFVHTYIYTEVQNWGHGIFLQLFNNKRKYTYNYILYCKKFLCVPSAFILSSFHRFFDPYRPLPPCPLHNSPKLARGGK